ncbi:histidine kinase [Streptomyces sp. NPDC050658]|uniref:sensor histidine kinase n=1 Tax=unclassified Streptomyces TaxID=2593676 RepID=UPI00342A34C8
MAAQDAWRALAVVVPDMVAFGRLVAPDTTGYQALITVLAALPSCAALCLLRAAPVAGFCALWLHAVLCGLISLVSVLDYSPVFTVLAGLFSVVVTRPLRAALAALTVSVVPMGLTILLDLIHVPAERRWHALAGLLTFFLALYIEVFLFGRWVQVSRAKAEHTRNRLAEARRTIIDERTRIARELHDIVAHTVTVMVLQAGGAQRVLRSDPDRASLALGDIESQGRNAMGELRRMLTLLRAADQPATSSPHCGLAGLDQLFESVRRTGVSVVCEERGRRPQVPESLDLTVYRVVQEALTNVTKHAGPGSRAVVSLLWSDTSLRVGIEDDGAGTPSARPDELSTGHGITGLRERVEVFGGSLSVASTGEGYRLSVILPIPEATRFNPTLEGPAP